MVGRENEEVTSLPPLPARRGDLVVRELVAISADLERGVGILECVESEEYVESMGRVESIGRVESVWRVESGECVKSCECGES